MKESKNNRGITLIALIITIIILLILAIVSIRLVINQGILSKAKKAVEDANYQAVNEELQLGIIDYKFDHLGAFDLTDFINSVNDNGKYLNESITKNDDNTVTYKGYIFEIDENGEVTFVGKDEPEEVQYIVGFESDWLFDKSDNSIYRYVGDFSNLENNILVIPTYWKENEQSTEEYQVKKIKNNGGNILTDNSNTPPSDLKLKIPYGIEELDNYAFQHCSCFTGDLIIPNSVKRVGVRTFADCTGFDGSLIIGDGVEILDGWAFNNCINFTGDLVIGKSIKTVIDYPFYKGSSNFTGKLTIKAESFGFGKDTIEGSAFSKIILEKTVKEIPGQAFYGFSNLQGTLVIPNTVTSIGGQAFYNCSSLTGDLIIPDSVKNVGQYAFEKCTGFNGNLVIGDGVEIIGSWAFSGCRNFTGDLVIGKSIQSVGNSDYPFYGLNNGFKGKLIFKAENMPTFKSDGISSCEFSEIVIEDSVKNIPENAFKGFSKMKGTISIPNSVESIGENAFYNCNAITEIKVDKAENDILGAPWGWTKGTVEWLR